MSKILRAIISFGMFGAIIGGILSWVISIGSFDNFFLFTVIGFIFGSLTCFILIKIIGMNEADFAKGLSFECPNCKGTVYEIEQHCSKCGCTNEGYDPNPN